MCNDGKKQQVNYLIDEAQNPGKGADCIISLVDHYLEKHSSMEDVLYLHADNCVAQNKNNAMIQYLLWRVMNGKHDSIELSFMLVGHTKFSPDRLFGLIKKVYRHSSVSTLVELQGIVERSTAKGQNIAQLIETPGEEPVVFRQWTTYLSQFFKAIPSISTYHSFVVKAGKPGAVFVREFSDSKEKEEAILKTRVDTSLLKTTKPAKTLIPGLDAKRQWYLYENIRMHCTSRLAADNTCLKPSIPKPLAAEKEKTVQPSSHPVIAPQTHKRSITSTDLTTTPPTPKRPHKCSKCQQTGHNKRNCPN